MHIWAVNSVCQAKEKPRGRKTTGTDPPPAKYLQEVDPSPWFVWVAYAVASSSLTISVAFGSSRSSAR